MCEANMLAYVFARIATILFTHWKIRWEIVFWQIDKTVYLGAVGQREQRIIATAYSHGGIIMCYTRMKLGYLDMFHFTEQSFYFVNSVSYVFITLAYVDRILWNVHPFLTKFCPIRLMINKERSIFKRFGMVNHIIFIIILVVHIIIIIDIVNL